MSKDKKSNVGQVRQETMDSESRKDANDVTTKSTDTVKPAASAATPADKKAARSELRHKIAASVGSSLKFSEMIGKAHPKGDTKLEGIDGSEAVVESIESVQKQMMEAVSHEPKASATTKKAAEALRKLVVAGKVDPSNIDNMVKQGMDKEVASYYKQMWGKVEGGSEYASALLKDYSEARIKAAAEENLENYKAKYAKAYELAHEMSECGFIPKRASAIKAEAEKIVNYDDNAYNSLKRVVAMRSASGLTATATVQSGVAYDSQNSITSTASSAPVSAQEDMYAKFTNMFSNIQHKRG